jgi:hypothetical protein
MMSEKTLIMAREKLHTIMLLCTYLVGFYDPNPTQYAAIFPKLNKL